jgi:uncharacterized protein YycO
MMVAKSVVVGTDQAASAACFCLQHYFSPYGFNFLLNWAVI